MNLTMKSKLFYKFISVLLIVFLTLSNVATTVFAQEASSSASVSASPTQSVTRGVTFRGDQATPSAVSTDSAAAINPFLENDSSQSTSLNISSQSLSSLLGSSLGNNHAAGSALVKQKSVIHNLSKKSFKSDESVQVNIGNATSDTVELSVTDSQGKLVDPRLIDKTTLDTQTTVTIHPPSFGFRPGKYTIHVADADGTSSTQDFTWGVLALNTDKSIYLPRETAQMSIAVLDEKGDMVCDANVSLEITDPGGSKTSLSTATKTITVNPQCRSHAVSLVPDYEASYQVNQKGQYALSLSATTKNGTNTITDTISVADGVSFDVARSSATRIYPANTYPMIFHIKANQDFTGTISDYVPASFTITPFATGSAQTYDASTLVMPTIDMQSEFGVPSLSLGTPFTGNFVETQGFGSALTDPKEKKLYAAFGLAGHDGLDYALPSGAAVLAADEGTISLAGEGAYGTTVAIDHVWGRSYYGHLSKVEVTVGQKVIKGEEIALSGNTGLSTGAHLHFGIKPLHPNMSNGYFGKEDPSPFLHYMSGNEAVLGVVTTNSNDTAMKVISWNVSMKKGEAIDLAYNFRTPPLSPQLYRIGPLAFRENGTLMFQEQRQWQIAVDTTVTVEQQINIIDTNFGTPNLTDSPTDNSLGLVHWDGTNYTGATVYFEAVINTTGGTISATLYTSGGSAVSGSTVTTSSNTFVRVRSSAITLTNGTDYTVRTKNSTAVTNSIQAARLIIVQTDPTQISNSETQVEVGNNDTTGSNTSMTALGRPKIYKYDDTKFSPRPTAYFEATLQAGTATTTTSTSQKTCGTGADDATVGTITWTAPGNTCGAGVATATMNGTASTHFLKATNLGFTSTDVPSGATVIGITAVVNIQRTGGATGQVQDGTVKLVDSSGTIVGTSQGRGAVNWPTVATDITYGGTSNTWSTSLTQADVISANFGVVFSAVGNVAGDNRVANVDYVKVTITYTTSSTATMSVELFNITTNATVATSSISTTSTTWTRVRSSTLVGDANWRTSNADQYEIRMKTSDATAPGNIANAHIILDQSAGGGITNLETMQQYINSGTQASGTTYSSGSWFNKYESANWAGGTFTYWSEVTMAEGAGTGTAALCFTTTTTCDTILTNSDTMVSTSTTYVLVRSTSSITPVDGKEIDVEFKNSGANFTLVGTAWMIIQVSNLSTAPPGPTLDQLMRHGKWFNNGVKQPFTF